MRSKAFVHDQERYLSPHGGRRSAPSRTHEARGNPPSALKASRKTIKLPRLGGMTGLGGIACSLEQGPIRPRRGPDACGSSEVNRTWTFLGSSIDDGPKNKAPRDAGRSVDRPCGIGAGRLELAAQPRRPSRGG